MKIEIPLFVAEAADPSKMRFGKTFNDAMSMYRHKLVVLAGAEAYVKAVNPKAPASFIKEKQRRVKQAEAECKKQRTIMVREASAVAKERGVKLSRADILRIIEDRAHTAAVKKEIADAKKRSTANGKKAHDMVKETVKRKKAAAEHAKTLPRFGKREHDAYDTTIDTISDLGPSSDLDLSERRSIVKAINDHLGSEYKLSDFANESRARKTLGHLDRYGMADLGKHLKKSKVVATIESGKSSDSLRIERGEVRSDRSVHREPVSGLRKRGGVRSDKSKRKRPIDGLRIERGSVG